MGTNDCVCHISYEYPSNEGGASRFFPLFANTEDKEVFPMPTPADSTIDAVLTFSVPGADWGPIFQWCKPGAHVMCVGVNHRTVLAVERAGFEIRDTVQWLNEAGVTSIVLARKPLEGTVAQNVLKWGVGGININACRVDASPSSGGSVSGKTALGQDSGWNAHANKPTPIDRSGSVGRWPANLLLTHTSGCVLGEQSGVTTSGVVKHEKPAYEGESTTQFLRGVSNTQNQHGGTGTAVRFFQTLEPEMNLTKEQYDALPEELKQHYEPGVWIKQNLHPTVKPIKLLSYLCKLITPPGGTILDPFMGSGSTALAAKQEGFNFIGIELESEYYMIANQRVNPPEEVAKAASKPPKAKKPVASVEEDSVFDLMDD